MKRRTSFAYIMAVTMFSVAGVIDDRLVMRFVAVGLAFVVTGYIGDKS